MPGLGVLSSAGLALGATLLSKLLEKKTWTLINEDTKEVINGQFPDEGNSFDFNSNWGEIRSLNRAHPLLQYLHGQTDNFEVSARFFRRDITDDTVESRLEKLLTFARRDQRLGRPPICRFAIGDGSVVSTQVLLMKVGNISYSSPDIFGGIRQVTFGLHFYKFSRFSTADEEVTDTRYHRTARGQYYELIAQVEYGDPLLGDVIRKQPEQLGKALLAPGDIVKLPSIEGVKNVVVTPTSVILKSAFGRVDTPQKRRREELLQILGAAVSIYNFSAPFNLQSLVTLDSFTEGEVSASLKLTLGASSGSTIKTSLVDAIVRLSGSGDLVKFQAWLFDNVDDQIRMGDVLDFDRTDPFTLSAWIHTSNANAGTIVSKCLSTGTSKRGYRLFISGGAIFFRLANNDVSVFNRISVHSTATTGFADGSPHHIVVTYSGSSTAAGVTIYVDDVAISMTTEASGNTLTLTTISNADLQIGGFDATLSFGEGWIKHVSIFDALLTASQVSEVFGGAVPVTLGSEVSLPDLNAISVSKNLVGWWKIDANDTGLAPTRWDLDGADDFISIGSHLAFERTDPFALSAWIRTTSTSGSIIRNAQTDATNRGYGLILRDAGVLNLILANDNSGLTNVLSVRTNAIVSDNKLHHVVVTYDGSSTAAGVRFYIDRVEVTTNILSNNLSATSVGTNSLCLGARSDGASPFDGVLMHCSIWDTNLSATDVEEIFANGNPPDLNSVSAAANLVGWWKLDGSDTIGVNGIVDYGPSGLNGTAQGGLDKLTPLAITDHVGNVGKWMFNHIDDAITIGDVLDFERTDPFTLSAWGELVTSGTTKHLVAKIGSTSAQSGYGIRVSSSNLLQFCLHNNVSGGVNALTVNALSAIADGVHHFAATYDGSSSAAGVVLYIDGVAVGMTTVNNTLSATTITANDLTLGNRAAFNLPWGDLLFECAIFDRALTALEVAEIQNGGTPPDLSVTSVSADLVGWWKLDAADAEGTSRVIDHSVNNNHGTAVGNLAPITQHDGEVFGGMILS